MAQCWPRAGWNSSFAAQERQRLGLQLWPPAPVPRSLLLGGWAVGAAAEGEEGKEAAIRTAQQTAADFDAETKPLSCYIMNGTDYRQVDTLKVRVPGAVLVGRAMQGYESRAFVSLGKRCGEAPGCKPGRC